MKSTNVRSLVILAGFVFVLASCKGAGTAGPSTGVGGGASTAVDKAAQIDRGKALFIKAGCWGCHPHGENSMHPDKPLKGAGFAGKYPSDQSIIDFVRKGSPEQGMPPFPPARLSDDDLKSVIAYVRSLSER